MAVVVITLLLLKLVPVVRTSENINQIHGKMPLLDIIRAVGVDATLSHFPTSSDLQLALDFEQHTRNLRPEELNHYTACSSYWKMKLASQYFASRSIQSYTSYLSLTDDVSCFSFHANSTLHSIVESDNSPFHIIFPMPSAFKLDSSVIHMLDWLSRHRKQSTRYNPHPIVQYIRSGGEGVISAIIRRELFPYNVTVEFLTRLWSTGFSSKSIVCRLCYKSTDISPVRRRVVLPKEYPASVNNLKSVLKSPRMDGSQWSRLAAEWIDVYSGHIVCQESDLSFTYRKHDVLVHIPPAMLHSPVCLSRLVAVMIYSPAVTKIAFTFPMQTQNDYSRGVIQSGQHELEPYTEAGLTGKGVIIGQADTGVDELSCYFIDEAKGLLQRSSINRPLVDYTHRKIVQYVNYSSAGDGANGHGTHTAGILVGECSDPMSDMSAYNGIASGAKLAFFDIGVSKNHGGYLVTPDDISEIFPASYSAGARIHSNSWGGGFWYDSYCHEVDKYLYENPNFLAIFSAGNHGASGQHTVLSPSLSKNAMSIGATGTGHSSAQGINSMAPFSSIGPAPDGRIKPDLVAPGWTTNSARSNDEDNDSQSCSKTSKSGTSMSAPVAGGSAALIHQYFSDPAFWMTLCDSLYSFCGQGAFKPSGAMTKALLLHSGTPITTESSAASSGHIDRTEALKSLSTSATPDFYQGYGRVKLDQVLPLRNSDFVLYVDERVVSEAHQYSYRLQVVNSTLPLKITLSWFDPPNTEFAAKVLLNDIDLAVVDPSGRFRYGNTQNFGSPMIGEQRDVLNNNEQIVVSKPDEGEWTVIVQAKLFPEHSHQSFSLVITAAGGNTIQEPTQPGVTPDEVLDRCHVGSGLNPGINPEESRTVVDVAIFDFWSQVTSSEAKEVTIFNTNDSLSVHTGNSAQRSLFTASLDDSNVYNFETTCLPVGCYTANMKWNRSGTTGAVEVIPAMGLLSVLPQCGVFLSPIRTSQRFCIDSIVSGSGDVESSSLVCRTTCQRSDHIIIDVLLRQTTVEGWVGSYYTVHELSTVDSSDHIAGSGNVVSGDTMEWGDIAESNICLPAKSGCYEIVLWSETNDDVHSPTFGAPARTAQDSTPWPYLIFSESHTCQQKLQSNTSVVRICTDGRTHFNATFYSTQLRSTESYTSKSKHITLENRKNEYVRSLSDEIGQCNFIPVSLETKLPEGFNNMSSFVESNCLHNCLEDSALFHTSLTSMCADLAYIMGDKCSVIEVRSGNKTCVANGQSCVSSCPSEVWCFYASVRAAVCPKQHLLEGMSSSELNLLYAEVDELSSTCQVSWWENDVIPVGDDLLGNADDAHDNDSEDNGNDSTGNPSGNGDGNDSNRDDDDEYYYYYVDDSGQNSSDSGGSSLSGGGNRAVGGATSSLIATGVVVAIGFVIMVVVILKKCGCLYGNDHALLLSGSDHGDEFDDHIVFDEFVSSKPSFSSSMFSRLSAIAPGIELGTFPQNNEDEDAIMEITL